MSLLWRISNHSDLSGEGGLRYSARWHTSGLPIVYLAASPAGAMIEILVHLELSEDNIPLHYQLLEVSIPDDLATQELRPQELQTEALQPGEPHPEDLQPEARPHQAEWRLDVTHTRSLGDAWLRARNTAVARVPSAILPETWNYLLNPLHPRMADITIVKSTSALYDPRLLPRLQLRK
jgi:RES domain-containing protein